MCHKRGARVYPALVLKASERGLFLSVSRVTRACSVSATMNPVLTLGG